MQKKTIPKLYVEGPDDVSAIAGLLKRHGYDTDQGKKHLYIKSLSSVEELLRSIPATVKSEVNSPCGFVLDIDIAIASRWQSINDKLKFAGDPNTTLESLVPDACPPDGYIGKIKDYPHPFGVWLMPDCQSDLLKLENLIETLIPTGDPLWSHTKKCTADAVSLVDQANIVEPGLNWKCFGNKDKIKAELRTWLAWQEEPGLPFGAAINNQSLRHNSPQAVAFLDWLSQLYGFKF